MSFNIFQISVVDQLMLASLANNSLSSDKILFSEEAVGVFDSCFVSNSFKKAKSSAKALSEKWSKTLLISYLISSFDIAVY